MRLVPPLLAVLAFVPWSWGCAERTAPAPPPGVVRIAPFRLTGIAGTMLHAAQFPAPRAHRLRYTGTKTHQELVVVVRDSNGAQTARQVIGTSHGSAAAFDRVAYVTVEEVPAKPPSYVLHVRMASEDGASEHTRFLLDPLMPKEFGGSVVRGLYPAPEEIPDDRPVTLFSWNLSSGAVSTTITVELCLR